MCSSSRIERRSCANRGTYSGASDPTHRPVCTSGAEKSPGADLVFAGVQTLARNLDRFDREAFDYVVVDEFHHAAAQSYRKVIDHFLPRFRLGLTATPERMDGADLLALCADNVPFQCGLVEGIDRSKLVPFHYWGVPDVVDFEPIPWRNGHFDPVALTSAVATGTGGACIFRGVDQASPDEDASVLCHHLARGLHGGAVPSAGRPGGGGPQRQDQRTPACLDHAVGGG